MGIEAQDFSTEQVIAEEEQYSGRQQCFVAEDKFKDFKKKGVSVKELYLSDEMGNKIQPELVENEFIILKADQSLKKTGLFYHWSYWKNWMDSRKQKVKKGQTPDGPYVS